MFHLVFILTLLSSIDTHAGAAERVPKICRSDVCITLPETEIPAEAGLCAVIPCSVEWMFLFRPLRMIWYKCDPPDRRCGDNDIIFDSDNHQNVQPGFRGRVSLLESDVSQIGCSIVINDLKESDSGSYQLRVIGLAEEYFDKVVVSVQGLRQKPMVEVPPLTEEEESTLTCTAPGLCSGSVPGITWTWSGAAGIHSHIPGNNIMAFLTEDVRGVAQRHSSTLTFNSSAELHGTNVTCRVSFSDNTTTEETAALTVAMFPKILNGSACHLQSDVLTCVCLSAGFPLPTITWPLLESHSEYSLITVVSSHTVSSTVTFSATSPKDRVVECVSYSHFGIAQHALTVQTSEKVTEHGGPSVALLPTIAGVSLVFNVVLIISLAVLWNSKKKVKPAEMDRTYMSLRTANSSPEYDVIGISQK